MSDHSAFEQASSSPVGPDSIWTHASVSRARFEQSPFYTVVCDPRGRVLALLLPTS